MQLCMTLPLDSRFCLKSQNQWPTAVGAHLIHNCKRILAADVHLSFLCGPNQIQASTTDGYNKEADLQKTSALAMASAAPFSPPSVLPSSPQPSATTAVAPSLRPATVAFPSYGRRPASRVVAVSAIGELSSDSTTYLVAGAIAVALVGTAFPLLFSRKDICPECDGAGFIRQAGVTLRANAARKDQSQIVCPRCNGLGKLGQIDK